jgi:signal transduction histidine kinase
VNDNALLDAFADARRPWDDLIGLQPDIVVGSGHLQEANLAALRPRVEAHRMAIELLVDTLETTSVHGAERTWAAEVQTLFQRLVSAQEEERRRIAREIHDQLGQHMTALRMNLEALHARAAETELGDLVLRTQSLAAMLDESIDFVTVQLRPAVLDQFGLPASLRSLVNGWSKRFGIPSELDASGLEGVRLPSEVEANLYRIAQEGLHNVFKHANASHVSVFLGTRAGKLVLIIEDDGCGSDPANIRPHLSNKFGVVGMRERAALVGGEFQIESSPGQGTTIIVRVPAPGHVDGASHGE